MALDRIVVKEVPYPERMSWQLAEQWAEIPFYGENDPANPEWQQTPTIPIDLTRHGYGLVNVKNEAVQTNPTESIKDRPAWEAAAWHRNYARTLFLLKKEGKLNGNIGYLPVPRLSIITAGNMGRALAKRFEKHGLPPIKMLLDVGLQSDELKNLHADLYITDLNSGKLSPKDIRKLTNNENGTDITSLTIVEPHATFYDWHVHEAFNEQPDEIYLPCGSARLFENYIYWQHKTLENELSKTPDPRLKATAEKVISTDIFAAEPLKTRTSTARALVKAYNPFRIFDENDVSAMKTFAGTGRNTGVYKTRESYIKQAALILGQFMQTGPSAAAGLALYMQRYDDNLIDPRKKILIINTGKGI